MVSKTNQKHNAWISIDIEKIIDKSKVILAHIVCVSDYHVFFFFFQIKSSIRAKVRHIKFYKERNVRLRRGIFTCFSLGIECFQYCCVAPDITINDPFVNENSYCEYKWDENNRCLYINSHLSSLDLLTAFVFEWVFYQNNEDVEQETWIVLCTWKKNTNKANSYLRVAPNVMEAMISFASLSAWKLI